MENKISIYLYAYKHGRQAHHTHQSLHLQYFISISRQTNNHSRPTVCNCNALHTVLSVLQREREIYLAIGMLSERHIAHRTDNQHKKRKKEEKTQQFGHQYKHEYTKLTAADYNF